MKLIAISISRDRIASRLDSAEHLLLVEEEDGKEKSRELIILREENPLKKIEKIIRLKPDILICGGLTRICESKLRNSTVKVISWVQGYTEYILSLCLNNKYTEGVHYTSRTQQPTHS